MASEVTRAARVAAARTPGAAAVARTTRGGALSLVPARLRRSVGGRGSASSLVRAVAAGVRAGAEVDRAWAAVGVRSRAGVPRADQLAARGLDDAATAAVRAAARLAGRSGAPPAALLDGLAVALEGEDEVAARRRAALAGPASSARLLALLPLTGPLLGLAVGADPVGVLADGAGGTALLLGGLGLAGLGRLWTARLLRRAEQSSLDQPAAGRGARRGRWSRAGAVRDGPTEVGVEVEVGVLLELLAAATASGASVPEALGAVGHAARGSRGSALVRAGLLLGLGAGWAEAWSHAPRELGPAARALGPAWLDGAGPVALLRAAAAQVRRDARAAAEEAAGRLGVRLLLPLAVCHLPAFVLVGLVPVLVSLARETFGS